MPETADDGIYTYDFSDQEDITRVLVVLRGPGVRERLSYRTDADTQAGRCGVVTYVSQLSQLIFEIRRSAKKADHRATV